MKIFPLIALATLVVCVMQAQAESGVHQGQYQKNLTYQGPVTGDEIIYTLYLPPGHGKDKGPYPLIVFLHGAGGGNASSQVMQSYEAARKAGKIGNFVVVFPEKYGGTVWRDGAKDKGGMVASIPSNVSSWDSSYYHSTDKAFAAENVTATSSKVDRFRNLRWEGGEYVERPKHWQKDAKASK